MLKKHFSLISMLKTEFQNESNMPLSAIINNVCKAVKKLLKSQKILIYLSISASSLTLLLL